MMTTDDTHSHYFLLFFGAWDDDLSSPVFHSQRRMEGAWGSHPLPGMNFLNYFEAAVLGQSRNSSRKILLGRSGKLQTNTKHGERWDNYTNGFVWQSRAPLASEGLVGFLCPYFLSGWIASLFAVTWTQPCRPTGASCFRDLDRLMESWGWPWWICLQFHRKICWWREKLRYPDAKGSFRIPCRCQHDYSTVDRVFVAKFGHMRNYVIIFHNGREVFLWNWYELLCLVSWILQHAIEFSNIFLTTFPGVLYLSRISGYHWWVAYINWYCNGYG